MAAEAHSGRVRMSRNDGSLAFGGLLGGLVELRSDHPWYVPRREPTEQPR